MMTYAIVIRRYASAFKLSPASSLGLSQGYRIFGVSEVRRVGQRLPDNDIRSSISRHHNDHPPSITWVVPVVKALSSDAR